MKKLFMVSFLLPHFAFADEPTKEQTIEFLQEKLNTVRTAAVNPDDVEYKISSPIEYKENQNFTEISPCIFQIAKVIPKMDYINKLYGGRYGHSSEISIFNAEFLDPETIKIRKNRYTSVEILTTKRKDVVKTNYKAYVSNKEDCPVNSKSSYESHKLLDNNICLSKYQSSQVLLGNILSPVDVNASKVAKAMRHLIKVCGGQGELF